MIRCRMCGSLMADNPDPFTFKDTISYIVGRGNVATVDRGPDDPRSVATQLFIA